MMRISILAALIVAALALQPAKQRAWPRRRARRTAVEDPPTKLPQRMPPAAPDTPQPLETTRRTALYAAGACACGCGAYLATTGDETFLDAAAVARSA